MHCGGLVGLMCCMGSCEFGFRVVFRDLREQLEVTNVDFTRFRTEHYC
jgi:hypothetical protein